MFAPFQISSVFPFLSQLNKTDEAANSQSATGGSLMCAGFFQDLYVLP